MAPVLPEGRLRLATGRAGAVPSAEMDDAPAPGPAAAALERSRVLRDEAAALRAEAVEAVRRTAELVIRRRTTGARSEVRLEGELDLETVPAVEAALVEARAVRNAVRLDLGGVTFVDSTGVRLLLAEAERSRSDGWELVLGRPSAAVARTLTLTGVDGRLPFEG